MEMTTAMKCVLLLVVSCALLTPPVTARPPHRQKRVSDQRLAELETLLALAKMKNRKYITLPVGYGLIDVQQIGRRKRSLGGLAAASSASASGNNPLVRDPSATDYDLGEIIANLSSSIISSPDPSSSDSVKDEPILDGNYVEDEEDPSVIEDSGKVVLSGLRPGARTLFLGMKGGPHQRFY